MFMNTYIQLLEVTTLILLGFLAFRVFQCNRAYYHELKLSKKVQPNDSEVSKVLSIKSASKVLDDLKVNNSSNSHALPVMEVSSLSGKASSDNTVTNHDSSKSSGVLSDYIGAFFTETITVDIEAFKADKVVEKLDHSESSDEIIEILPILRSSELITGPELIEPAILSSTVNEARQESEDDDSVILVMTSTSSDASEADDKVMSDKVVHAMLDEARLACVS